MYKPTVSRSGFTMLELLLTVAALVILAAAVTIVLEPERIFEPFDRVNQESDIRNLHSALRQYYIDNRIYPEGITANVPTEICNTGSIDADTDPLSEGVDCEGKVDLSVLVPRYLTEIPALPLELLDDPTDATQTGYSVSRGEGGIGLNLLATADVELPEPEITLVNSERHNPESGQAIEIDPPTPGNILVVTAAHRNSYGLASIVGSEWNEVVQYCVLTGQGACLDNDSGSRRGMTVWWKQVENNPSNQIEIQWGGAYHLAVQEYALSLDVSVSLADYVITDSHWVGVNQLSLDNIAIDKYSFVTGIIMSRDDLGNINNWNSDLVDNATSVVEYGNGVSLAYSYGSVGDEGTYDLNPSWEHERQSILGAFVFQFQ